MTNCNRTDMKRYTIFMLIFALSLVVSCDKPDVTEPDDKQEQTGNNGNENEGGNEDGTGNENGETPSEGEGEGETEKVKSMTITLEKLTATKAYFKASTKKTAPDIEIGIYYSQFAGDHIYDCERVWDYDLENGECELVIKDLDANTTYYYRPYLFIDGTRELGEELSFTTPAESITIDNVTVNGLTATFAGHIDLYDDGGIYCSTTKPTEGINQGHYRLYSNDLNTYTYTVNNLSSNSSYYYCTYRYDNEKGMNVYGTVKNFSTGVCTLSIDNVSVLGGEVTFMGNVQLDVEGGILYSTASNVNKDNCLGLIDLSNKTETFEISINLNLGHTYYYRTYYWSNAAQSYVYGEVKSFKCEFQWSMATDLSKNESANCYIVSQSGFYKIRGVKGNSSSSVGSISSAKVLWESFGTSIAPVEGDLISGISCKDGYIGFYVAGPTLKTGNALIAAIDANSQILWSWHIWMTDQPQKHVYKNNAGTMMDRNLGATSATPGDVGALGLLYQWGRKDPFLGSSSISSSNVAASTITWPSAVYSNSSNGTIEYATANPTTFITGNNNFDWQYSQDNTRWQSEKTIYDPCPEGWRIPDGGDDGVWSKAGFDDTTYDGINEGISFSISSPSTTWYPAAGYLKYGSGVLGYAGYYGCYWSCLPFEGNFKYAYSLYFRYDGDVSPSDSYFCYRAYGYPVRCLQESK